MIRTDNRKWRKTKLHIISCHGLSRRFKHVHLYKNANLVNKIYSRITCSCMWAHICSASPSAVVELNMCYAEKRIKYMFIVLFLFRYRPPRSHFVHILLANLHVLSTFLSVHSHVSNRTIHLYSAYAVFSWMKAGCRDMVILVRANIYSASITNYEGFKFIYHWAAWQVYYIVVCTKSNHKTSVRVTVPSILNAHAPRMRNA